MSRSWQCHERRRSGLGFAFTAVFIAMGRAMFVGHRNVTPWIVTFGVTILLTKSGASGAYAILTGSLIGLAISTGVRNRMERLHYQWMLILFLGLAAYGIRLLGLLGGQANQDNPKLRPVHEDLPGCLVVGLVAAFSNNGVTMVMGFVAILGLRYLTS